MNLALFDFDGTITHNDTFSLFLKFSLSRKTQILGGLRLAPYIAGALLHKAILEGFFSNIISR